MATYKLLVREAGKDWLTILPPMRSWAELRILAPGYRVSNGTSGGRRDVLPKHYEKRVHPADHRREIRDYALHRQQQCCPPIACFCGFVQRQKSICSRSPVCLDHIRRANLASCRASFVGFALIVSGAKAGDIQFGLLKSGWKRHSRMGSVTECGSIPLSSQALTTRLTAYSTIVLATSPAG